MRSAALRQTFIDHFVKAGHTHVESASLVPAGDPTLLFTNSGMAQFKDLFLGTEKRPYVRAVTAQRCVRAGGKHNDLENVGYTARHHTFFEMLGNFSFGDYFKEDAIAHAWQLLTRQIGLPKERLWLTVHHTDDEAAKIWRGVSGVPAERIIRLDEDNFWQMGDTGPCGPCSEIFYDHGPDVPGGVPGSPDEDAGERFIEIWNLVFMQYERYADGTMKQLPKPSVDTGMGLERMAAVLQGVHTNYETDLFVPLIARTQELCPKSELAAKNLPSLRIIADHLRAAAFLVADGVAPANEGRGYVLRRIIRRALRHANKLDLPSPLLSKLLPALIDLMGEAYPILTARQAQITQTLDEEERQFTRTLDQGMAILTAAIQDAQGTLDGATIFKLYDTYGFPPDLTVDVAREHGLAANWEDFQEHMTAQRNRSRAYSMFSKRHYALPAKLGATRFTGYAATDTASRTLTLLDEDGKVVRALGPGAVGTILLAETPFYAESGGQVGDTGQLITNEALFQVTDTKKQDNFILHFGKVEEGTMRGGDAVRATIDVERRAEIRRHHTATHLLHAALHQIIGDHAQQRGSLVTDTRLRLDFAHRGALRDAELAALEDWVNAKIAQALPIQTKEMPLTEAKQQGALALFGEKYGEQVRVVTIGDAEQRCSIELCAGTHAAQSGELGPFQITSESSIAAGIRRVEAQTGAAARQADRNRRAILKTIGTLLSAKDGGQMTAAITSLRAKLTQTEKQLDELRSAKARQEIQTAYADIKTVNGIGLIVFHGRDLPQAAFLESVDACRAKLKDGVAILLNDKADSTTIATIALSTQDTEYPADALLKHLAAKFGGGGGGAARQARGGIERPDGKEPITAQIEAAARAWIKTRH